MGGVGDFSVILDEDQTDLYSFLFPVRLASESAGCGRGAPALGRSGQSGRQNHGLARRRVAAATRHDVPQRGRVGADALVVPVATPIYEAGESWHDDDQAVDAFWGPSVHWNTHIQRYVMLLNRAENVAWTQEGIYVAFSGSLEDPQRWSVPRKIYHGGRWYPQVIGLESDSGTDKIAGETARFFMGGESNQLIRFGIDQD